MDYNNSKNRLKIGIGSGKVVHKSPSNLAIIKYWGKYGNQFPRNPSISLTLSSAYTETELRYSEKEGSGIELVLFFEGKRNVDFEKRMQIFFESITGIFPFLEQLKIEIYTKNSFPHSAGIASSASAMSAIALCICDMERRFFGTIKDDDDFLRKASFVARLGSGSASRSVFPAVSMWGKSDFVRGSSDEYAIGIGDVVDDVFKTFHDDILFVSSEEKSVSSSAGHDLMKDNPYAEVRYKRANDRIVKLFRAMKYGDVSVFGEIAESEALELHALMMTSEPSYILMNSGSLAIIKAVRNYRAKTGKQVYFSLDAGPNIHLLYPDIIKDEIRLFVEEELLQFCEGGKYLADGVNFK